MNLAPIKRALTDLGWSGVQGLLHPSQPLNLHADWPEIDALLTQEEWPFVRADFEVSAAQPMHAAHVVRRGGQLAGFFVAHGFDNVSYLDMMIVGKPWRRKGVARPLYVATQSSLRAARGTVVHTTPDSARIIQVLGFEAGATYTLLARDSDGRPRPSNAAEDGSIEECVAMDAGTFGVARPAWTGTWLARDDVQRVIVHDRGTPAAFAALRPRRDAAWGIDLLSAADASVLPALIDRVLMQHGDRRLECFVRDGSPLDAVLRDRGFSVPAFFHDIGPLVEWRKGDSRGVGDSGAVHTLLWL